MTLATSPLPQVLIVEDDAIVAMELEMLVEERAGATVTICSSVADARRVLTSQPQLQLALLDIDVLDGKTFEIATRLRERGVPFLFISGSRREELPESLTDVPFIPKPYSPEQVGRCVGQTLARARSA